MTISTGPAIEHCPNCGAPLDLVAGSCRWCGQHVTIRATPPRINADDDVDAEVLDRIGVGDFDSKLPVPTQWILVELSWLACDPAVEAFLVGQPDLLELARRLTAALTAAGERIRGTGLDDDEIALEGLGNVYSADDVWTFDLGIDLIAWLASVNGIDADKKAQAGSQIWGNDVAWKDHYAKPLKKAGDGPADLRELRARVPRRGHYDAQGRRLPDLADGSEPPGPSRSHHWRR